MSRRSRPVAVQNFSGAACRRFSACSDNQHRTALLDVIGVEHLFADEVGLLAGVRAHLGIPSGPARPKQTRELTLVRLASLRGWVAPRIRGAYVLIDIGDHL